MTVRIGFVGSGGIANAHMRSLAQIEDAEMVAFCDVVPERAKTAASTYGGSAYTRFAEMYDREDLDGLYICVPPFAHGDQEVEAIRRGLPMFVEKPVAAAVEPAEDLLNAIQEAGLITSVGYHWRYMDTVDKARRLLGDRPVGFALGTWLGGMPGVPWWRVMEESGGQMVEQTTHIFDLARYLLGDARTVHALARTGLMTDVDEYSVHDASVANVAFESGAIASITSACMLTSGRSVGLDLFLSDQVLRLTSATLTVESEDGQVVEELGNNPTVEEDRAFVQAISSGDTARIRSDYADAVATLKLTVAATRSAIEERVIDL